MKFVDNMNKNDMNAIEVACFVYGQMWGMVKVLRALGDRARARELLPMMRKARELCLRRCHKCVHLFYGRCQLRGIKACVDSNAVGCEYYIERVKE